MKKVEVVQEVVVLVLLLLVVEVVDVPVEIVEVVEVPVEIVPGGGEGGWREANRDFIS